MTLALDALFALTTERQTTSGRHIDRREYLVRHTAEILVAELPYVTLLLRVRGNTPVERRAIARRREFDLFVRDLAVGTAEEGALRPGIDLALTASCSA